MLPRVCRGWRAAADRVQPLADVRVDGLAAACEEVAEAERVATYTPCPCSYSHLSDEEPYNSSSRDRYTRPPIQRAEHLALWLPKHSSSVRSLCIPCPWAVSKHLDMINCLGGILDVITGGCPLTHLVDLEIAAFNPRQVLALFNTLPGLPFLQHLLLKTPRGYPWSPRLHCHQVTEALAPLQQLRTLHLGWPEPGMPTEDSLVDLLMGLPPSIDDLQIMGTGHTGSIPLSCVTHLVNLRYWEHPAVSLVVDDVSTSDTRSSIGGSSSSGGGNKCGGAALTALTGLKCLQPLDSEDARLQAPNLRFLELNWAGMGTWEQLQGLKQLQHLSVHVARHYYGGHDEEEGEEEEEQQQQQQESSQIPAALCSQLQRLDVELPCGWAGEVDARPWVDAITHLTQLTALRLQAYVVMDGGPALLAPLTQLRELTVHCSIELPHRHKPPYGHGWANTRAGAVEKAVAAAVEGSQGQLQRLVLLVSSWDKQWVGVRSCNALPGVVVEVRAA